MYDAERPQRPERPLRPEPRQSKRSILPVIMVLIPVGVMLLGIIAFTGQAGLMMLGAIATIPAFLLLHYVLWGHWLIKSLKQQRDDQSPRED